jgi:hypothetical protein
MTEIERIIEFAKNEDISFDSIYFECEWNGYKVYATSFDAEGDYWVGIPNYILIDSNKKIRRANTDEVQEILVSLPDE